MVTVLDGKSLAQRTEAQLSARVERLKRAGNGATPVLATILVGDDPASATYVKMKANACGRVGMQSRAVELSGTTTTSQLLDAIRALNVDPDVHGILLQHPVSEHINRSEEHTSELQSLMRISYAVFCLKKKTHTTTTHQP